MSKYATPQFVNFDSSSFLVNGHEYRCASDYCGYNYTADRTQDILAFYTKNSDPFTRTDTRCYQDEKTGLWQSLPGSIDNSKLGLFVLGTGTLPLLTCSHCTDCKRKCYGRKARFLYPVVHDKMVYNTVELLVNPSFFFDLLAMQVETMPYLKALRFDVTGDIVSERHLHDWEQFAKRFPKLPVFGYTKTDLGLFSKVNNFNVVNSYLPDGELNFGSLDYVLALAEKYKDNKEVMLCPKGLPGKDGKPQQKQCSDCLWCAHKKYAIFLEH